MVAEYKVAYPSGLKLNSQMFERAGNAETFADSKPLSITMKLQSMNDSGAYSWSIENISAGWLLIAFLVILLFCS